MQLFLNRFPQSLQASKTLYLLSHITLGPIPITPKKIDVHMQGGAMGNLSKGHLRRRRARLT